MMSEGQFLWFI